MRFGGLYLVNRGSTFLSRLNVNFLELNVVSIIRAGRLRWALYTIFIVELDIPGL